MTALTTTEHAAVAVAGAVAGTLVIGTVGAMLMPAALLVGAGAIVAGVAVPTVGAVLGGWGGWLLGKPAPSTVANLAAMPNPPIVGHV